jgi:regulator of protease activity HflC (stomatin/prohibitin superfamily)
MLSTQRQIDSVTVTVTTADRVEVAVAATTAWGITDANRAALRGGHDMQRLREVVHRSAQGVLANMISVRKISDSAVGAVVMDDGTIANPAQLKHCNAELELIGAEISEIAIVQMHIVNEATRLEIAKIAAIPAKTKELRDVAEAQATSDVTIAKGRAQAMLEMATAEAESITMLARARQEAGEMLGDVNGTAATLACIQATGQALKEAKSSVFFVPPGDVRSLMANQNILK